MPDGEMTDTAGVGDVGVFQLRRRPSSRGAAVSLRQLLDATRTVDLAGMLLVYDRCLAALEALHRSGRVHGAVSSDAISVGADGVVTLKPAPRIADDEWLVFERPGVYADDVRALTCVLVDALTSAAGGARIPMPARELLQRGLGEGPPLPALVSHLRADIAEASRAFLGDGWRADGAAALATAVRDLRGATAATGAVGRRTRVRLAGAAIGASLLVGVPIVVAGALASAPPSTAGAGQAGISSATRTAPSDALVGPATADPRPAPRRSRPRPPPHHQVRRAPGGAPRHRRRRSQRDMAPPRS